MKIILDTNFLIYCAEQKVDYVEEIPILLKATYEIIVLDQVIEELNKIKKNARKYEDRQAASLALQLLKHNKIKTVKSKERKTDDSIIRINKGNIVATHDLDLSKKVERAIVIRGKKKLDFR